MNRMLVALASSFLFITPAVAAGPEPATVVEHMKEGLEGPNGAVRLITLKVISNGNTLAQWNIGQANGTTNGAHWILTVVLSPPAAKGMALLDKEQPGGSSAVRYAYLPAAKRAFQLGPLEGYDPFFATDFAYQDLGFIRLGGRGEALLGTEIHDGMKVYKLEDHPINHPYYSKVISYVAENTLLPVERDFYDHSGKLYKSERCTVQIVDGTPAVTKIVMKNVQMGSSSEIDVVKVIRGKNLPGNLFDPKHLPEVADDPFWKTLSSSATGA
jgi:hypothetical protein